MESRGGLRNQHDEAIVRGPAGLFGSGKHRGGGLSIGKIEKGTPPARRKRWQAGAGMAETGGVDDDVGGGGEAFDNINPATGALIGLVHDADSADVDAAAGALNSAASAPSSEAETSTSPSRPTVSANAASLEPAAKTRLDGSTDAPLEAASATVRPLRAA